MDKKLIIEKRDINVQKNIIKKLQKEGYATYAYILSALKFKVTDQVKTAAINPIEDLIMINPKWEDKAISFVIRHEILHRVLKHFERTKKMLGDTFWVEIDSVQNKARLWATDLELGDKGYDTEDIELAKHAKLNGEEVHGLVVEEIEHQYGVKLAGKSYEEIYNIMLEIFKKEKEEQSKNPMKGPKGSKGEAGEGSGESGDGESEESDGSDSEEGDGSEEDSESGDGKPVSISLDLDKDPKGSGAKNPQLSDEDLEDILDIKAELSEEAQKLRDKLKKNVEDNTSEAVKEALKKLIDSIDKNIDKSIEEAQKGELGEIPEEEKENQKETSDLMDDAEDTEKVLEEIEREKIRLSADDKLKASRELERIIKDRDYEARVSGGFMWKFKKSLADTLATEVGYRDEETWRKLNKVYADTDFLKKGRATVIDDNSVPVVNVYIDRSGSWSPSVYNQALKSVDILGDLQKSGRIKINIFYFAVYVHTDAEDAVREQNNSGQPLIDHIKDTKPTNVIVMTDEHLDRPDVPDYDPGRWGRRGTYIGEIRDTSVIVPGKVWYLLSRCYKPLEASKILRGRLGTETYDIYSGQEIK